MLSGSETAITSIPIQKIHQLDENKRTEESKKELKKILKKTIGGILVGNNFVNILMASVATSFLLGVLEKAQVVRLQQFLLRL